jgi:hypothetical protein
MRHGRLVTFAGAAIVASLSVSLAGTSVAYAATVPASPVFNIPFNVGSGCEGLAAIFEDSDVYGAFVAAALDSDPCGVGVEGVIAASDYNPLSNGGDIHTVGPYSDTGTIPISSANHHGIRWWDSSTGEWRYNWKD